MGRKKYWKRGAAMAAALWFVMGPAPALAQAMDRGVVESVRDRPHPDYDPRGLRFGGFDARPSLELGAEHNDNLFASKTNERSDTITSARARLEVASHWSRHSLRAEIGGQQTWHQDFGSEDATTGYAVAEGRADIWHDTQLGLSGRIERGVEARASPDSPTGARDPIEYDVASANAYAQHTFNRLRIRAAYDEHNYDYHDAVDTLGNTIDEDFRDRTERVGTARAEFALSPRVAVVGQAQFNDRAYDIVIPGQKRDSSGSNYLIGANFDVTHLIRGEVTAGYLDQKYDDPAIGTVKGAAVSANFDWYPTQLTTVNFVAERSVNDAGFAPAASFLLSRGGVRVDHELRRNVILTAGAEGGRREYRGVDRDDDLVSAELGARYLMNRSVVLSGGYRYERETSSGLQAGQEYVINRIFVSIGLRI